MLVLSRHSGESIRIGDTITITINSIGESPIKVRIGIDAPLGVPIHRAEVYNRIVKDKRGGKLLMDFDDWYATLSLIIGHVVPDTAEMRALLRMTWDAAIGVPVVFPQETPHISPQGPETV